MENLRFYRVREDYIEFLHKIDHRVQFNKTERRPYVGIVLTVGSHDYFVPLESPKPNHANLKSGIHLMKIANGKYGLLGFNNMIPAKKHHLIELDIEKEPDRMYGALLKNQSLFCNRNKAEIYLRATRTYEAVTVKEIAFFKNICCDFRLLETEYVKFHYKSSFSESR